MTRMILTMHTTVDGFIADETGGFWPGFGWPDDVHAMLCDLYQSSAAVIYGRNVFDDVVPFWTRVAEGADGDAVGLREVHHRFAQILEALPKYVVSRTLPGPDHHGAHVLRDNVPEHVGRNLEECGGTVLWLAGPAVARYELAARPSLE